MIADAALPQAADSLPLFTVALDGRPLCVVRAPDHRDALRLAQGIAARRLHGFDRALLGRETLTLTERARLSVRAPTGGEIVRFDRRAMDDPAGAFAVLL